MDDRRELEKGSASQEEGNTTEEHSLDELAKGVAEGTLSRSKALQAGGAAILGGLLSIFALPSRDADAAKRRLLKTLWAVTNIDASHNMSVAHSKGVTGSSKLGTGIYKIGFNRDVSGCAYSATFDESSTGFITTMKGPFSGVITEREVLVSTFASDGLTRVERSFNLVVNC